jgi:probable F420-dependent oxidoreductase
MRVDHPVDARSATLDCRQDAARAEAAGFDGLWLSEIAHDPFLGVALAATATERLELGTGIAVAFARNPMSTATLANDLQALSGGRLLLGLGTQVRAHVTRRFGMPWSRPRARLREYVLAMRATWDCWHTGAPLEFEGEFYTHDLMPPMFVPPPHPYGPPAVLLAAVGEAMTETVGEVADGFLVHGFSTERYLREVSLPALRRGRELAGSTMDGFTVSGIPMLATGSTQEELTAAVEDIRARIAFYASTPAYRAVLDLHGWGGLGDELHTLTRAGRWDEMAGLVDDDVLHAFAVVGEPERVGAELLRRFGDVVTRMTLHCPDEHAEPILATLRAAAR